MTYDYIEYKYDVTQSDGKYIASLQADTNIKWEAENLTEIHDKAVRIITQYSWFQKHLHKDPMNGVIHYDNSWDR